MSISHLRQVALNVHDMDHAVAFYRDVIGLDFIARFDPPGLAFFDIAGTRLLLEAGARRRCSTSESTTSPRRRSNSTLPASRSSRSPT